MLVLGKKLGWRGPQSEFKCTDSLCRRGSFWLDEQCMRHSCNTSLLVAALTLAAADLPRAAPATLAI
jgi:hypothetical protein